MAPENQLKQLNSQIEAAKQALTELEADYTARKVQLIDECTRWAKKLTQLQGVEQRMRTELADRARSLDEREAALLPKQSKLLRL